MLTTSLPVIKVTDAGAPARRVKYLNDVEQIQGISDADRELLREVSQRYVFRANDYSLVLLQLRGSEYTLYVVQFADTFAATRCRCYSVAKTRGRLSLTQLHKLQRKFAKCR